MQASYPDSKDHGDQAALVVFVMQGKGGTWDRTIPT